MRQRIFGISLLVVLLMVASLAQAHAATQILFVDDFASAGVSFPAQWTASDSIGAQSILEQSGYLWLTVHANNKSQLTYPHPPRIIANSSVPILGPNTPDGFFFFAQYRMNAFNMTYSSGANRTAQVNFGIRNCEIGGNSNVCNSNVSNYIAFKLIQGDLASGAVKSARQSIYLTIVHPMNTTGPGKCLDLSAVFAEPDNSCQPAILYNPSVNPISLNGLHNFNIMGKIFPNHNFTPANDPSWIAFNVDTNAWVNVTQQACRCIDGSTGKLFNMYPFIETFASNAGTYTQSLGTFVSLVEIADFVPSNLVFSKTTFCITDCTTTLGNPINNFAFAIGFGNIEAGGIILAIILIMTVTIGLGVITKAKDGKVRVPGIIWTVTVLGIETILFLAGVLPALFLATAMVLSLAIGLVLIPGKIHR